MGEQERCAECGRVLVQTMAEFWKNPSYSCPVEVARMEETNSDWLDLVCAEGAKNRLKSELALACKALAAAKNLLAVLHRDGGHHTERVGFEQSCSDAGKSFPRVLAALAAAEEIRKRLDTDIGAMSSEEQAELLAFDEAMAEVRKGEGC